MLKILQLWQSSVDGCEFAFVHLFMNLKDPLNPTPRIPSEYIPALGRIRTDLDQFSFIEREALMYHGYTLIDAQIKEHCKNNLAAFIVDTPKLKQPPLFLRPAKFRPSYRAMRQRNQAAKTREGCVNSWKRQCVFIAFAV